MADLLVGTWVTGGVNWTLLIILITISLLLLEGFDSPGPAECYRGWEEPMYGSP